ncbi:hypothetical protein TOK_3803 [Pseudonocardia sp. N23]|nr:hypothetical protein TOK_3803 [Pseudonocardia sp. N23]
MRLLKVPGRRTAPRSMLGGGSDRNRSPGRRAADDRRGAPSAHVQAGATPSTSRRRVTAVQRIPGRRSSVPRGR